MIGSRPQRVFLSASVPLPSRNPRYYQTADTIAIRDAIRALVIVIVQNDLQLVFGGHPAVTPMIRRQVGELGACAADKIIIYQSRHFVKDYPPDNAAFERIIQIPAIDDDREKSLLAMRSAMLEGPFCCGIFVGGMEGVEDEFSLFRARHPRAIAYPIATTGAAAEGLFRSNANIRRDYPFLGTELRYLSLMRKLLET